jgi:hypothetical protein
MALLVAGFPALAAAQNEGGPQPGGPQGAYVPVPAVNVTGMLQSDGEDGYVLVDQASGESIELKGKKKKLAKHEGTAVTLTGRWRDNDPTSKMFRVSKVEAAPAEAAPAVAAPAVTAPAEAAPAETDPASPESTATDPAAEPAPESPSAEPAPESPATEPDSEAPAPESPDSPAPEP